jgi:MFS family permease
VISIQEPVIRAMTPYVTSDFRLHSLTAATGIVSSIVGGLSQIPLAKILDTWGRPQGIALSMLIWDIGYIMMAATNSVEMYAAAQVFASVGQTGVSYCMTVFISDTSHLKNRALMLAFATTPYIFTTWVGGPMSQSTLNTIGWRWAFGIFTVVLPIVVLPLAGLLYWNQRKARRAGLIKTQPIRVTAASIRNYAVEVDLIGILILAAGLALFLLPFSLWSYQANEWRSPMIICMIVFGGLLLATFGIYEKYFAIKTFIPFELLTDRTVLAGGIMFVFVFFNHSIWGSYFGSFLQVGWGLSVTEASYITSIRRVGQCLFAVAVGAMIKFTGRFKWVALTFGVPLMMLGTGLLIPFRSPGTNIGLIVMTQIFLSFSSGAVVLTGEIAMMAPGGHQHVAVILACLNLFCSIGSAVGATVSGAIWTGTFPQALARNLPEGTDVARIYGQLPVQLSYPLGSPERDGIIRSYGHSQRLMLITSLGGLTGACVAVCCWRSINVKNMKQTKGLVA